MSFLKKTGVGGIAGFGTGYVLGAVAAACVGLGFFGAGAYFGFTLAAAKYGTLVGVAGGFAGAAVGGIAGKVAGAVTFVATMAATTVVGAVVGATVGAVSSLVRGVSQSFTTAGNRIKNGRRMKTALTSPKSALTDKTSKADFAKAGDNKPKKAPKAAPAPKAKGPSLK